MFLYDGSTGDSVAELSDHKGTVFAVAWERGSDSQLASFAADGTVKLWDAEKKTCVRYRAFLDDKPTGRS